MTRFPIPDAALEHHIAILGKTVAECAYAAGFFDGEGTVFIAIDRGRASTRGPIFNLRVTAAQVDRTPLVWLQSRWGGSVVQRRRGEHQHSAWTCFSRGAAQFLRDVRPYLIVKADEADVALEFQAMLFNPGTRGHTPEYRAKQSALRDALMELKRDKERIAA